MVFSVSTPFLICSTLFWFFSMIITLPCIYMRTWMLKEKYNISHITQSWSIFSYSWIIYILVFCVCMVVWATYSWIIRWLARILITSAISPFSTMIRIIRIAFFSIFFLKFSISTPLLVCYTSCWYSISFTFPCKSSWRFFIRFKFFYSSICT